MKTTLELFESAVRAACAWDSDSSIHGYEGRNPHDGVVGQLRGRLENLLPIPGDESEDLRPLLARRVEALEERLGEVKEAHDALLQFAEDQHRLVTSFHLKVL